MLWEKNKYYDAEVEEEQEQFSEDVEFIQWRKDITLLFLLKFKFFPFLM